MTRVKIMLMSICLVAITGGILAFKARTADDYCTTAARTYTTAVTGPTYYTCKDVNNIDLDCTANQVQNVIYTAAPTLTTSLFCTTLADNDGAPCRQGTGGTDPLKKCPNPATTTTEPIN